MPAVPTASYAKVDPTLSIVMPVYNTGPILIESVRSVVAQTLFAELGDDYWELLIVDDGSTDADTLASLDEAQLMSPAIRVIPNQRSDGAAGSRNTGVFAARGAWIGFLDSDDLWYPDFLRKQRDAFATLPDAQWRAAHFDVGDDAAFAKPTPLSQRSPCLYRHIENDYDAGRVSMLNRPVDILLRCGCMQVMTVQIARDLIRSVGGFNEDLAVAEDYDLWLRLANIQNLHIAPIDAGIYRVRNGSLTKSGRPMYYCEDQMLVAAKAAQAFAEFGADIDWRLQKVYSTYCFHFRAQHNFREAARYALKLIGLAPFGFDGWRHLAAIALRR